MCKSALSLFATARHLRLHHASGSISPRVRIVDHPRFTGVRVQENLAGGQENNHERNERFTRREVLVTAAAAAAAAALPSTPSRAAAKYTRYNVTGARGQKALASYAKGVDAMLKLPADHPQNWFRNSFIHLMDCPHGNWWFYVWHRGYIGYFEQTIRSLSGDPDFAIPYWDWTQLPQIPNQMFDGVLTPTDAAFAPYTGNLAIFQSFIKSPLAKYFGSLNAAQQAQQKIRGYSTFDLLWNDVTGFSPTIIKGGAGISGNMAYAITCGARYLSRDNPKFNPATAKTVSEPIIKAGLEPTKFYDPVATASFTSSKTPSHNSPPGTFSVLEGMPHNQVHNYIGGVGPLDPGPYGNMTNFLSPVDPIFFLHHANMDRLWDVWTRKQMALKLPYLPPQPDLKTLSDEPFLFFVDGQGKYVDQRQGGRLSQHRSIRLRLRAGDRRRRHLAAGCGEDHRATLQRHAEGQHRDRRDVARRA